ncbi:MAG: hypothetical protein NTZ44_01360 [Candidatus Nomurabacteria bacterium]|nr:hypothetical protein [Candidatus Nomurabacteria bacterium]
METLSWSVIEYEEKGRTKDWFWALGIIVVAGSIAAIIFNDGFFAVLLILGGISLGMFALKKPEMINYELSEKGLRIQDQLYTYKNIKMFFVKTNDKPTLFIKSNKFFFPMISAPLGDMSPEKVNEIMRENNVLEQEMKEHFSEKVLEYLGL